MNKSYIEKSSDGEVPICIFNPTHRLFQFSYLAMLLDVFNIVFTTHLFVFTLFFLL